MAKKNELEVVKENTALVAFDYGSDTGVGFEDITAKDLSIPFLSILQALSPQVEDNNPEGSKAGQLYNTVTKELIDGSKGVGICPVHYEEAYVEWVPREKGGGFVALHDSNSDIVKQTIAEQLGKEYQSKLAMKNGNQLVQTQYVYALLLNETFDAPTGFCLISFTGSKIKTRKDWFTSIYLLSNAKNRPPLFANRALLRTTKVKNEKGTFFNFQIEPINGSWRNSLIDPSKNAELLVEGKNFRDVVLSGMAKVNYDQAAEAESGVEAGADGLPF
jgi:hypothetical protein